MGANFKLFHRFFINMRGTVDRKLFDLCRQRNWPGHSCAGALGRIHNLDGGLIEHAMIERLQANPNALSIAHFAYFWTRIAGTRFGGTGWKCDGSIE